MRLASKVGESLRLIVISPSELASEPTSLVRGRMIDVLFLTYILFRQTSTPEITLGRFVLLISVPFGVPPINYRFYRARAPFSVSL